MRNPLIKRIPREFKQDLGKYLAIFIFMILFIGMVSGFIVTDNNFLIGYNESFQKDKVEDGHFSFTRKAPESVLEELEKEGNITIHEYYYFEEDIKDTTKTIRVYSTERELNYLSVLKGKLPQKTDEIALDRMFADNNEIVVGDKIVLKDTELTVTGLIASPDYSCLYENSSDMIFDSINFSVGVMTKEGFTAFDSNHITYNYAWLYPEFIEREDEETAKHKSDELLDVFEAVVTEYDESLMDKGIEYGKEILEVNDYLPRYLNQAINFVGEDMGGDKIMFLIFDYILTVVLAFVFAITVSNTITMEAGVIGTLRASGYTKGEILSHYIVLPVLVTFVAATVGNILGYTLFCNYFVDLYYGSYSLGLYEEHWSGEAFFLTTLIPILIMFVVNLGVIMNKLRLSPLKFIRRDLSKHGKKKALRLHTKIPFLNRFRLRIILQNIPNYITLFFGIFIGGVLVVFGIMFGPLLENYKEKIINDRICDYQYILTEPVETEDAQAEKYAQTSLKTTDEAFMEDDISVFGIVEDSRYVDANLAAGKVVVSNGISEKFGLSKGDTITLKDPYNSKAQYTFEIGDVYNYNSGMAVFMPLEDYAKTFHESTDSFTGYFSDNRLKDVDEKYVAAIVTVTELTKVSDQLTTSMGEMMVLFKWIGVVIFVLLMFIMSKQIIEKNAASISMTKILGFSNGEIGGLYIAATSVVVVLSLLVSIPLLDSALREIFDELMYKRMTGYIPFEVTPDSYLQMFVLGVCSYALVAVTQMVKISKIPKSDALKNVE